MSHLFGYHHAMIIMQKHQLFNNCFVFYLKEKQDLAIQFYLNHLPILQQFCQYFCQAAKPLIKAACKQKTITFETSVPLQT